MDLYSKRCLLRGVTACSRLCSWCGFCSAPVVSCRIPLCFAEPAGPAAAAFGGSDGNACQSFDDRGLGLRHFHVREAQLHDGIAEFHVATPVLKPHDLRRQDQWLDAPLQLIAPRMAIALRLPARAAFAYLFDFYFSYGFADPLRALRLTRPQKNLRTRLREHDFGIESVMLLQLAASLKAQNNRVVRLAVPGDGIVQLGQFLQKRNLVQNEPHPARVPFFVFRALVLRAHYQ